MRSLPHALLTLQSTSGAVVVRAATARRCHEVNLRVDSMAASHPVGVQVPGGELGVTAIEYALLAALIALAIIGGVRLLGADLGETYQYIADQVGAVM